MQVSVEATEGLERKLTVAIPAEQIDTEVNSRLASSAKKIRLDGFRPGKVPRKVVKQRFGDSIRAEVLSELANQSFQKAVMQEELRPVGQPSIVPTNNVEGENFEFVATFEVYPEVVLADCAAISVEKLTSEITDNDVQGMIDKLLDQQSTWTVVERAAANGDQLNIDFAGTKDGEAFEGGSAEGTELELGSKRMIEGFEAGLEGAKAGEEVVLNLTFPDDYHAEDLKGAAVVFTVTVNTVSEKTLPEMNAEFFAKFEVEGDLDDFKSNVKDNMTRQLADAVERHTKQQVMDGLFENNKVDLPAAMIAEEVVALRQQSLTQFGAAAENFDMSLLPDTLFEEQARKRVALGVILSQAVEHFEVKPDREKLMTFIDELAASYDDPEEVKKHYMGDETRMQQVQLML
ncbi:MAG TPA: trigger factor, partial [Cellvibrionales bacterium]|nr:trigger factor [Cellvibrionales bacterium]